MHTKHAPGLQLNDKMTHSIEHVILDELFFSLFYLLRDIYSQETTCAIHTKHATLPPTPSLVIQLCNDMIKHVVW
jgi:hypothetical protein